MSNPKKPTAIKITQGTFRRDRDGKRSAAVVSSGEPEPTSKLTGEMLKHWQSVVPALVKLGVATASRGGRLTSYSARNVSAASTSPVRATSVRSCWCSPMAMRFDVLSWFWSPEGAAQKRQRDSANRGAYYGWAEEGSLELVQGDRMDQDIIRSVINEQAERFRIHSICFDPWNAEKLRLELQAEGIEMVEFNQSIRNFTEPMKEWLAKITGGKLRHGNNPVMRWMASNLAAWEDASGNIRPNKKKSADKIDGHVAGIMELAQSMFNKTKESVYETRGIRTL